MFSNNRLRNKWRFQKYLIVVGSFIVYFILDGVSLSFGIFTREFIEHFEQQHTERVAFITVSLVHSVPLFLSPFICMLIEKFGCRSIALIGSTLLFGSFIITRFLVDSIFKLNVAIGGVASLGLAMIYIPSYLIISYHFDKRRALATGIAVSGSGLGLFLMSPLAEYLISNYGWLDAYFLFGAIASHTFISACTFRPAVENTAAIELNEETSEKRSFFSELKIIYSSKRFMLINLAYFGFSAAIVAPCNFLPNHVKLNDLEDPQSWCVSLIGISNLIGQIVIGILSDMFRPYDWLIFAVCSCMSGVLTICLPFLTNIYSIYVYSLFFGFSMSINYVLQSTLVIESLGIANLTIAFGFLQFTQGVSVLFGTPLLGWIKDYTGNYTITFIVSGVVLIFSGFWLILWPIFKKKTNDK